jgi:hypothetical protein
MTAWYQVKLLLEHATGVSMDALHILVGVLAQLLFAALVRVQLRSWLPWIFVLILALLNEASDFWVERWPEPAMQFGESLKDVALTMLVPTMLMLALRIRPAMFADQHASILNEGED